jgi:hypothetical protein
VFGYICVFVSFKLTMILLKTQETKEITYLDIIFLRCDFYPTKVRNMLLYV